ncbi:MAG TPA: DUF4010 domain-containing protein [Candidatus Binatia bacterium]|nr:DUF4010 domain-containing protein [Candidatus Binatia bacterium]
MDAHTITVIAGAALGGAAVGVERQWSGHALGPAARFGGVRTFTLLGGLAGTAGRLWTAGAAAPAAVLLAAAAALVVAAYAAASRRDVDATTEVAALVVLAAGFVAGTGALALASGIVAVTVLLLVEKSRLHALVAWVDDAGMRAAARFAVMAVVVLPLLPAGPYGPLGGVRPRELWLFVLFFSGLSFLGYVARRAAGPQRGDVLAGLLGGLVSSTSVTLAFARTSREEPAAGASLACGATAASAMMFVRTLTATALLHPPLGGALVPYLAPPAAAGAAAALLGLPRLRPRGAGAATPPNPLQLRGALQTTIGFQLVLFAVHAVRTRWGSPGVLVTGALLGLTDVDALTVSMVKGAATGLPLAVAARATAAGALANTLLKLGLAATIGRGAFRGLVTSRLGLIGAAAVLALALA